MRKRKCIPKLSDNVNENIEILLQQAEQTSNGARNTVDDLIVLSNEFLDSLYNEATRLYVFWKVVDEYICKKYNRPNHLLHILCNLEPKYFIVYQLLKDSEVIYVGKTTNIHKRLVAHKKKAFNGVSLFKCPDEESQDILEQTLIEKYRPILNKALNFNLVDKSLSLPEFQDISTFHLDFFSASGSKLRLSAHNHVWANIGFVAKDKLKNTPHWWTN
jgi:hypothetical protein